MKLLQASYYAIAGAALCLGLLLLVVGSPLLGNYQLLIVQSGSMEPAIPTGALVLIRAQAQYQVGDVVTFQTRSTGDGLPTTHRIIADGVSQGEVVYETKGDANVDADLTPVRQRDVVGKVVYSVPYLGYLLDFARQPLGFALLIGVPAVVVVLEELGTILAMFRDRREKKENEATNTTV